MLQDYYQTSMRVYIPLLIVLFALTYYLSTIFIADEDFLKMALQDGSQQAQNFNTLFFSFSGTKMFLSWLIKGVIISTVCYLIIGTAFGHYWKIALLSMFAYVLSNLTGFMYKLLFMPTSVMELRRNALSLWSTGLMDDRSGFIQNLSWHANPFEVLYIFLFAYGAIYISRENGAKICSWGIAAIVIVVDLAYIMLTALW
jgi:hypothetical protein